MSAGAPRTPSRAPRPRRPRARSASRCLRSRACGATCRPSCATRSTPASTPTRRSAPGVEELGLELDAATPRLNSTRPVPAARRAGISTPAARERLARIGALVAIFAAVAWLAFPADRPGAALVAAFLVAPIPLLLDRPLYWGLPALAPLLGALGIAPLYPALAALAPTAGRRFALGLLGFAWLAIAESLLDRTLLFGTVAAAPSGWATSAQVAATDLLGSLFAPDMLLAGLTWGLAAAALGYLLRGRMVALELLGVLVWAAGVVAVHRLLAPGAEAPAAAPLAIGAVALALVVLWLRTTERPLQPRGPSSGLA